MGIEKIIFCRGLKSCHLGLRFAASKGGCFIWKTKIKEFRLERKTRYEGKINANESKGFLLLGHYLRKRGKEAVVFVGNNVLGTAGEGIIHCNGGERKPKSLCSFLCICCLCPVIDRLQELGAVCSTQPWTGPGTGEPCVSPWVHAPPIVVTGLKCSLGYPKLSFANFLLPEKLWSCRHVPVMHL